LKNKLEIVFKEKEDLSLCFPKNKNDFENHNHICKGKNSKMSFDKNEFQFLKNRMNILDSILKICPFNVKIRCYIFKGKNPKETYFISTHNACSQCTTQSCIYL